MKYSVKIQDKSYLVEIEDINARPVVAYVEGIRFEVIPDTNPVGVQPEAGQASNSRPAETTESVSNQIIKEVTAPLPGTVIKVFVKAGDILETGQVIVIIEAMKMKNSIRSTGAGKIAEVLVREGETVAHKQLLVRFE
jgi:biotin carboxyl carrier protein